MIFNKPKAIKHTMNDEDLLKEILTFTLEDVPKMINRLNQYLDQGSSEQEIAELAHKIKGSAGAVSAELLFDAALELEVMAKKGSVGNLSERITQVEKAFNDFHGNEEVQSLLRITS